MSKKFKKFTVLLVIATMVLAAIPVSAETNVPISKADLNSVKAIEIYSRVNDEGVIETDYIPSPRELDDYHLMDLYGLADVPYKISELRLADADALTKYPDAETKYEALSKAIADDVYDGLMKKQAVFFTGADGDTAIGVAAGVRRAYPDAKVGAIYLDAHGNITPIEGIMGVAENAAWDLASGEKAPFDALLMSDARDLDEGSGAILDAVAESDAYYALADTASIKDATKWPAEVQKLADKVDVIYLHVDADILHQGYISHMDTGAGEGPDIWAVINALQAVMDTGKVAAVNMASTFSEDPGFVKEAREPAGNTKLTEIWTARGYQMPQYHEWETIEERVNRLSLMSIRSAIRMTSAVLGSWTDMPDAPNAVLEVPAAKTEKTGNMKDLKVVEILTRTLVDNVFVGRNIAAEEGSGFTYEDRGTVIPGNDMISPYLVPNPREIDDFKFADLYNLANTTTEVVQVDITNEEADEKYPEMTRYEGYNREVSNEVYEGLSSGKAVLLDAMGCVPCVGIAGGMRRAFGDEAKLGIIYIDAHGDINTLDSTYSGGIGGVCLAPVVGVDEHETAINWWNTSSDGMRTFDELLHCSANNLDSGVDTHDPNNPYEFGEEINILKAVTDEKFYLSAENFQKPEYFKEVLADFADNVDAIYLHIDMDFLDNSQTMNSGSADCGYYTGRPGPDIWDTMENLKAVMETDKVSVMYLASVTSNRDAGAVDDSRMFRRGYAYPDVEGEIKQGTVEEMTTRTNRTSSAGILQGMRIMSTVLNNWENCAVPASAITPDDGPGTETPDNGPGAETPDVVVPDTNAPDNKADVPGTGDANDIYLYVAVLVVAAGAYVAMRRMKYNK